MLRASDGGEEREREEDEIEERDDDSEECRVSLKLWRCGEVWCWLWCPLGDEGKESSGDGGGSTSIIRFRLSSDVVAVAIASGNSRGSAGTVVVADPQSM